MLASVLSDADALRASRIFGIALIALSLVPLTGFGGQVSLCQMSFAAIGALVMAHHGQGGDPMALLLAAVVCAVVGALVALPALRLSGLYLALATAAFAVFLDRWVFLFQSFELGPWTIKFWEGGRRRRRPGRHPRRRHDRPPDAARRAGRASSRSATSSSSPCGAAASASACSP